jgi:hemolysin activation/secretion protein
MTENHSKDQGKQQQQKQQEEDQQEEQQKKGTTQTSCTLSFLTHTQPKFSITFQYSRIEFKLNHSTPKTTAKYIITNTTRLCPKICPLSEISFPFC